MVVRVAGTIRDYTNNLGPVHAEPIPNREVSVRSVRFLALLAFFVTVSSFAATFPTISDSELVGRSDAIVVGTVTSAAVHRGTDGTIYTDYALSVEDVVKGSAGTSLTIREIGGILPDGFGTFIPGSATYTVGERVLVFLRERADGTFYTSAMTLGHFRFERNVGAQPIVVRDSEELDVAEPARVADRFISFIRGEKSVTSESYLSATPASTLRNFVPATNGTAKLYVLSGSDGSGTFPVRVPCAVNPSPCGTSIKFDTDRTPTSGESNAISQGVSAWTGEPNSNISLGTTGVVTPGTPSGSSDGRNVIYLEQGSLPSGVGFCDAAIACTIGFVAGTPTTFDGDQFANIVEADIAVLSSFSSSANVLTHEMGHSIGFNHSNASGVPNPTSNAVMNSSPGSLPLKTWDLQAVQTVYGNGPACQPVTTITACCSRNVNSGTTTQLTTSGLDGTGPYTYQWFEGQAGDTSKPVGTNSSTFTTPPITTTISYWVKVTNCVGAAAGGASSNTVTLTPVTNTCTKPTISAQPQSQTIGSGTTTVLSVGVTGSTPFTYQWYEGVFPDTSKPVANTASFTTPALTKATSYWVHVSNSCGQADSQTATISIIGQCQAPQIVMPPASRTIGAPAQVGLVAMANGEAPLTYQWFNATSPNQTNPLTGLDASDDRFVRLLYVDLLGHEPDGPTTGILTGLLQGGQSKQAIALQVLSSTEYQTALISSYYRAFLRRSPASAETAFFLPLLGPSTDEEVEALILGSTEYFTGVAGGTNTNFVSQLYSDLLGRAPSSAELTNSTTLLSNGFSRSDVALLLLRSSEVRTKLVQGWFVSFLRRPGTTTEVSNFVNGLNNGQTDEQIIANILGSTEYSSFGSVVITPTVSSQSSFWVRVSNRCSAVNSDTVNVTVQSDCASAPAPSIVTQPVSTTTITGVPVFIGVGASGVGPFSFQWFEGNTGDTSKPVGGGVNSQLQVLSNTVGTKTYWVRVSNACSRSVNSNAATVTINCGAPAPKLFADSSVRSGLAHSVSWTGDNTLYSSFELQIAGDGSFSNATTQTLPAVQLPAGTFNVKSFTDSVDKDTRFYYRVRGKAVCNGQFSQYSEPATTLITAAQPSNTSNVVLNVGGNTTFGVVTQDLFIPGFATSGKTGILATGTFTATSDRDFVTIVPSSGPLPPEGTTVKVNIDTAKIGIGSTQANIKIVTTDGLGKTGALGASRTTSTSVSASKTTPVSSTPKDPNASPESLIVLAVGHGQGGSGPFQSDVRVTNIGSAARNYLLTFTPAAVDGTKNGRQTTISIGAGETKALNDIVAAWFGAGGLGEANLGTLEVRPLASNTGGSNNSVSRTTVASSLTYFVKQDGATFGQYIPALPLSQFLAKSSNLKISIQQIQQNPSARTNIGVVEGSGQPAVVELKLFDKNNNQIGVTTQSLLGFEFLQRALTDYFPGINTDDARLEVKTLTDVGKVSAYASIVESKTSDPTLVFPKIASQVSANRYVVPGVANLIGANNSNFHTDMRVYNASSNSVPVTMSFSGSGNAAPFSFTMAPGEIKTFIDIVKSNFKLEGAGGAVIATTPSNSSLVLTARTYSIAPTGGTFGQFIPGVTPAEGIGLNERAFQITQLEQSAAFRSNVGVVEVAGQPATVRLSLVNPDSKTVPTIDVALAPGQFVQLGNIFSQAFGASSSVYNGRVSAQVISGTGKISAYGSLIDNRSADPAFIPPQ